MSRFVLCTGALLFVASMMSTEVQGADQKGSPIQREMVELLDLTIGLTLVPKSETAPGEEFSFRVTDQVIDNMQALREAATPIEIPQTSELATKKGAVLKELGFIPRKNVVNDLDPYLFDITDVTIENMRGMTIIILADGTVKQKVTE